MMSNRESTASSLPSAQTPETPEESSLLQIKPLSKAAGGIPAIVATAKTAWEEMGVARGVRTLLKLNQKTGFDCPGCAWPEPDGERSHAEFCENGAKHVADEATTKRVTPEFFRQWSVADLAGNPTTGLANRDASLIRWCLRRGATHYEPISWDEAFALIAAELNSLATLTKQSFTLPDARATKPRFSISFSSGCLAPTIFLTAQTCATSRAARRWAKRSASAREQSRSKTSIWPRRFSSSDRIPAPIIREC